jgi:segregation and condensation protein A
LVEGVRLCTTMVTVALAIRSLGGARRTLSSWWLVERGGSHGRLRVAEKSRPPLSFAQSVRAVILSKVSYRVELPVFSGPMDLLLHLVRQSEVDIHVVAIAPILDDYLKHLTVLQQLDLHDIGDFVVMASTLMEIKSRELLPNEAVELDEELDPRDDLIRRLLEYKRYRDLARELDTRSGRRARQSNLVLPTPPELKSPNDEDLLDLGELGVWDLTSAFAKLLDEIGQHQSLEVEVEKRDVGYYTHALLDRFKKSREASFSDVFDRNEGRYGLIGTLIALLEMMKQGYLRATQENCSDDINLAYTGSEEVTADLILAGITAEEMFEDKEKAAQKAAETEAISSSDERATGVLDGDEANNGAVEVEQQTMASAQEDVSPGEDGPDQASDSREVEA